MQVETYLFFDGRCEEAIEFYQSAIDANVKYMMRFSESKSPLPPEMVPAGGENKIFHATITVGGTELALADDLQHKPKFDGFALLIRLDDPSTAERFFAALSVGGRVILALHETFWAKRYGIVVDKFGVTWKVQVGK